MLVALLGPYVGAVFRPPGFTVAEYHLAYHRYADIPPPAPTPAVNRFNKLTVQKWHDYLEYGQAGKLTEAQMAEQTRTKKL